MKPCTFWPVFGQRNMKASILAIGSMFADGVNYGLSLRVQRRNGLEVARLIVFCEPSVPAVVPSAFSQQSSLSLVAILPHAATFRHIRAA